LRKQFAVWGLLAVFFLEFIIAFGGALAVLGGAVVPADNLETAADVFGVAGGTRGLAVILARFTDVFNFGAPHFAIIAALLRRCGFVILGLRDPGHAKQGQAEPKTKN